MNFNDDNCVKNKQSYIETIFVYRINLKKFRHYLKYLFILG